MQRPVSLSLLFALTPLLSAPARAQWTTDSLSSPRFSLTAVTLDGKCFFAGGTDGAPSDVVDIYDAADGSWSTTHLSVPRSRLAATVVGQYALFAAGATSPSTQTDVVDVFDSLTNTWSQTTLSQERWLLSATTVGTKAIFAGGGVGPIPSLPSDVVDIYDASLGDPSNPAAWSTTTLSVPRGGMAATTVGCLAFFAGGADSTTLNTVYDTVDVYDDSTGTWCQARLSQARAGLAATSVGSRAYFGGGVDSGEVTSDAVDIYDASLGEPCNPATWTAATLGVARVGLSATALGNTVLFAGGFDGLSTTDAVDMLNAGTGHWSSAVLSQAREGSAATSVGGKAFIAGGRVALGIPSAVVDIYGPVGLNYCAAEANSTGYAASISASGSSSLAANDLELRAVGVPNQPFVFFHAANQIEVPFGNGIRCAGGDVVRLPAGLATGNVATTEVDLPSAGITTPGQRNFQCWFRDPAAGGAGFDTSDGLSIHFVP